jgi:hypothetical protein
MSNPFTSHRLWPILIISFLALNVVIVAVTVTAAHRDGGPALVDQVQERSLRWDQWRAAAARSDALGWLVDARIIPAETAHPGTLTLNLRDSKGPVVGADLHVTLLHDAQPKHAESFNITTDDHGIAIAHHTITSVGNYTIRITCAGQRDRAPFIKELNIRSSVAPVTKVHPK